MTCISQSSISAADIWMYQMHGGITCMTSTFGEAFGAQAM